MARGSKKNKWLNGDRFDYLQRITRLRKVSIFILNINIINKLN